MGTSSWIEKALWDLQIGRRFMPNADIEKKYDAVVDQLKQLYKEAQSYEDYHSYDQGDDDEDTYCSKKDQSSNIQNYHESLDCRIDHRS